MLVFEERGKSEYPEKNLSIQSREPIKLNPHMTPSLVFGGRRVLSPLRHPCKQKKEVPEDDDNVIIIIVIKEIPQVG